MDRSVDETDGRVGELLDEYLRAARDGREPDRDAFVAAHPEVADALRAALVGFDFVQCAGPGLSTPASPGDEGLPTGTLGDFRLVREVGRGGMGVVYEAEQISLGRRVALKVLPFAAVLDERQLQRFKHEAQSAALLHHGSIVPVYSVGTERGVHYYAMQFIEGRTLADVIAELRGASRRAASSARARDRRPSPRPGDPPSSAEAQALSPGGTTQTPEYCRAVARLGVQAAEALDHAHENGVIHRDIKPANLMLDARGHLWVADFGLARSRTSTNMTMTGAIVGTVRYMSPEQALAKRVPLDHRTDVYSLGVTLLELLTLEPAFPGDDAHRVVQDIAFREPTRPQRLNPAVSAGLETILLKSVAKDPESRYATAREMADDLRRYLDDKPVVARRPPLADRAALWAKRHRAAVVAAAAVLVVTVVALAVSALKIAAEQRTTADALADTKRSAARAEANFRTALEAVDRMVTRVGTDDLAGVPGLEPVRRKLLADAVGFYERFLSTAAADRRVRYEAARAVLKLGVLHSLLGDAPAALASFERARSMLVELAPPDGPWSPAFDDLVHVEVRRASALAQTGRREAAVPIFEAAVALAERNAKERPDELHLANCLAAAQQDLGACLTNLGRYEEARKALLAAVERQEALVARAPDDPVVREELANSFSALTDLAALSAPEETEQYARKGLAYCESAVAGPADAPVFARRAWLHRRLGDALLDAGHAADAEKELRTAFEARVRQETEFPHVPAYASDAADCEGRLAAALRRLERAKDAEAAEADARARFERFLDRYRDATELRAACAKRMGVFAQQLAQSGKYPEAEAIFRTAVEVRRELVKAAPRLAAPQHELAWTLACMCGAARLRNDEELRLLGEAREAAERSLEPQPPVPEYRDTLAWVFHLQALALGVSGDKEAAIVALRSCAGIQRELASQFAHGTRVRDELADTLSNLGGWLQEAGHLDDADAALHEALTVLDALPAASASSASVTETRIKVFERLSEVAESRGRLAEAEGFARQSLALCEDVTSASLSTRGRRFLLAAECQNLAFLLVKAKRPAEAEPLYVRAIGVYKELAREDTANVPVRYGAAQCCHGLADMLRDADRIEEAITWYREQWRFAVEIAQISPERPKRGEAFNLRKDFAFFLNDRQRFAEARAEFQQIAEMCGRWAADDPTHFFSKMRVGHLFNVAVTYLNEGDARAAVGALDRVLAEEPEFEPAMDALGFLLSDGPDASVRDTHRALAVVRNQLEVTSTKADAWCKLAQVLVCDGQWKEGIAAYAKAGELGYQSDGSDWIYEALAHARLGDLTKARELHDRAVPSMIEHNRTDENLVRRTAEVAALLGPTQGR